MLSTLSSPRPPSLSLSVSFSPEPLSCARGVSWACGEKNFSAGGPLAVRCSSSAAPRRPHRHDGTRTHITHDRSELTTSTARERRATTGCEIRCAPRLVCGPRTGPLCPAAAAQRWELRRANTHALSPTPPPRDFGAATQRQWRTVQPTHMENDDTERALDTRTVASVRARSLCIRLVSEPRVCPNGFRLCLCLVFC